MTTVSTIELSAVEISADIGTFNPVEARPEAHLLDLTLTIDSSMVLIQNDGMDCVFEIAAHTCSRCVHSLRPNRLHRSSPSKLLSDGMR
jgi:hypothetical protein